MSEKDIDRPDTPVEDWLNKMKEPIDLPKTTSNLDSQDLEDIDEPDTDTPAVLPQNDAHEEIKARLRREHELVSPIPLLAPRRS